ncbi:MAG TPA: molybdenum cofactor biosynthesis protein [Archaeoglobaceae archaeon]|nr:molybdenum cofactor biosynthesis protein [Archaeoglobaceae archaeon]
MHEHEVDIEIKLGIVTISTSKWRKYGDVRGLKAIEEIDDESGRILFEELSESYRISDYRLIPDEIIRIQKEVINLLRQNDAVTTTGGTGITPADVTVEAIKPLLTKKIEGFGEIFRMLSYREIGTSAFLSRTFAGLIEDKVVFCLPGSPKAVKLGSELIKDSLKHLITHARGLK